MHSWSPQLELWLIQVQHHPCLPLQHQFQCPLFLHCKLLHHIYLHVNPNPNQQDYPDIQFWFKHDYTQAVKLKKSNDGVTVRYQEVNLHGQSRLSESNVNVMCNFIELQDGTVVDRVTAEHIQARLTPLLSRRYLLHACRKLYQGLGARPQQDSKGSLSHCQGISKLAQDSEEEGTLDRD